MTNDQPPPLCNHDDPSSCTPACEEKARRFDEWLRQRVREHFPGTANPPPHAVDLIDYIRDEVNDGKNVMLTNADARALLGMIPNLDPDDDNYKREERTHAHFDQTDGRDIDDRQRRDTDGAGREGKSGEDRHQRAQEHPCAP